MLAIAVLRPSHVCASSHHAIMHIVRIVFYLIVGLFLGLALPSLALSSNGWPCGIDPLI